ncbi:hypothetical protein M3J09_007466 [Ascochyta lentis]
MGRDGGIVLPLCATRYLLTPGLTLHTRRRLVWCTQ